MARPRNNIMRLKLTTRHTVARLLADGASYDDVRSDPEVAIDCAELGVALHNNSFAAYMAGEEYEGFLAYYGEYRQDIERRRLAAVFVQESGGADAAAQVATFELIKLVQEKLTSGEALDAKELAAVSGALAAYNRNRLAAEKHEKACADDAREAAHRAELADREARIAELEKQLAAAKVKTVANPEQVAERLSELLGIK